MATEELSNMLTRRNNINDAIDAGETGETTSKIFNPYTEFKEFTRQEIKEREKIFNE